MVGTKFFQGLIKIDEKKLAKAKKQFEVTGDEKFLKEVKKVEKHIKDMKKNIKRFDRF